jgi:hypothetical protein
LEIPDDAKRCPHCSSWTHVSAETYQKLADGQRSLAKNMELTRKMIPWILVMLGLMCFVWALATTIGGEWLIHGPR